MKAILLVSIITSLNIFAATTVQLKPLTPASCEDGHKNVINYMFNMKKFENAEIIELDVNSLYGKCENSKFVSSNFSPYADVVVYPKGLNLPTKYVPESELSLIKEKLAKTKITINKEAAFKKSNEATFTLKLFANSKSFFLWSLQLRYDESSDLTTIEMIKK